MIRSAGSAESDGAKASGGSGVHPVAPAKAGQDSTQLQQIQPWERLKITIEAHQLHQAQGRDHTEQHL